MMMLPACSTRLPLPPEIIEVERELPSPPETAVVPCPETLTPWSETIDKYVFTTMTAEEQVNAIIRYAAEQYGREYHKCAIRQRALVEYVKGLR
jgi:hypothetical protein